jgi:hypothetical protein
MRVLYVFAFVLSVVTACQPPEPAPASGESNPTVRDAVVKIEKAEHGVTRVDAQANLVTSASQPTRPGGNYPVPGMGLYFNWNLALLARNRSFIDVTGTQTTTGAINPGTSTPITNILTAKWDLGTNEPRPETSNLFAQVAVAPCTDAANPCAYDSTKLFYVTELMRASSREQEENGGDRAPSDITVGCLDPMAPVQPGAPPFELRQLTVITDKMNYSSLYHVFGCVVSDSFVSFRSISLSVDLLGSYGQPVAAEIGGNTRNNIGPIISQLPILPQQRPPPRLVALLAADIQALPSNTGAPELVSSAKAEVRFYGCELALPTNCHLVDPGARIRPVNFKRSDQ